MLKHYETQLMHPSSSLRPFQMYPKHGKRPWFGRFQHDKQTKQTKVFSFINRCCNFQIYTYIKSLSPSVDPWVIGRSACIFYRRTGLCFFCGRTGPTWTDGRTNGRICFFFVFFGFFLSDFSPLPGRTNGRTNGCICFFFAFFGFLLSDFSPLLLN